MEERDRGAVVDANYSRSSLSMSPFTKGELLTFKILGALPFLTRLANDFDGAAREESDYSLGFIIRCRSGHFDQSFDFFLFLVHI